MLVGALGDQSWRVRQVAVSGLARHGGAEAVVALLEALREEHRNPSVLNSALQALALSDVDVALPLAECLRSPDVDLRIYAASLLGERHELAGDIGAAGRAERPRCECALPCDRVARQAARARGHRRAAGDRRVARFLPGVPGDRRPDAHRRPAQRAAAWCRC